MSKANRNKSIYTGVIILVIGVIWLLRRLGVYLPHWVFSWEMLLIAIGVMVGIDNKFRNPSSYILIIIGGVFLIDDLFMIPFHIMEIFWPLLVIGIGLTIIFQSRIRKRRIEEMGTRDSSEGGKIDSVSVFNGVKKNIHSQDFSGGELVTIFGGSEINLMQSDFEGTVNLEVTAVFGGVKLIVPRHWEVRTEVTTVFGGVDDKRHSAVDVIPENKVLILTGTVLFGGLDIVNY